MGENYRVHVEKDVGHNDLVEFEGIVEEPVDSRAKWIIRVDYGDQGMCVLKGKSQRENGKITIKAISKT